MSEIDETGWTSVDTPPDPPSSTVWVRGGSYEPTFISFLMRAKDRTHWKYGEFGLSNPPDRHEPPIDDPVNHPHHYTSGKIEVIEAIEDWGLDYHCGNVVKYVARAGKKDPSKEVEDLKKAAWYLNRAIKLMSPEDLSGTYVNPAGS